MGKIVKNYGYNLLQQMVSLVTPLIIAPYIARVLGAESVGIYSYAQSIVTYFVLIGAVGSSLFGQREIAYVQDDPEKRTEVFVNVVVFRIITTIFTSLVYFTFSFYSQFKILMYIFGIELIAVAFDVTWFFQGIQKFERIVLRNIVIKALSIIFIFWLVKSPEDIYNYALCSSCAFLAGNISLWFYLPEYLQLRKFQIAISKGMVHTILILFLPQLAIEIYTVLDKTMIGLLAGEMSEVGYYEQAQTIIKVCTRVLTALGSVMLSKNALDIAKGYKEILKNSINKAFTFVLVTGGGLVFGIMASCKNFVPIYLGEGYDKVVGLLQITALIPLLIGISNVIGMQYLLPVKKHKIYTTSVFSGAIINFAMNCLLIPQYGAYGAGVASVIAEASVSLIQIAAIRKEIKVIALIVKRKSYLFVGVIMYIVVTLIGRLGNNFEILLLQVIIGILLYFTGIVIIERKFLKR